MKLSYLSGISAALLLTACQTHHHPSQTSSSYPTSTRSPEVWFPSAPPPNDHAHPDRQHQHPQPQSEPWVAVTISSHEQQVIQGYVAAGLIEEKHPHKGKKSKGLPPGLQKKLERGGSLPPGWEKKFHKGEVIPENVYKQCHPLPDEVLVKLPPQPAGTVLIAVGGKVARILAATRQILDVFEVSY